MRVLAAATLLILAAMATVTSAASNTDKCGHCRSIVDAVFAGMAATEGQGFGGGNTAWEEKTLGNYKRSETRFLDIMERVCPSREYACLQVLELAEDPLADWWKARVEGETATELQSTLCERDLRVCCPAGHFGKDCTPCPGGADKPCGGHGACSGAGSRDGRGTCKCFAGYKGKTCGTCKDKYFHDAVDGSCRACHAACLATCSGDGAAACDACGPGFSRHDAAAECKDVNECEGAPCSENFACENTAGSFTCVCSPPFELANGACVLPVQPLDTHSVVSADDLAPRTEL